MTDRPALTIAAGADWSALGGPLRDLLGPGEPDAVVVETSGSSGSPKRVRLGAAALRASGEATAQVLGGHGQWLLALPTAHVAGLQVLARSALAGTEPVELHPAAPFTADALAEAVARMEPSTRRYASLVPTQLRRALAAERGARALRQLDAVLVGGAASDPGLLDAARDAGVRVVTTYGMSETCGGCVYDGTPLPGVEVDVDGEGRIRLGGPILADGYPEDPVLTQGRFVSDATGRWFVTDDRGAYRNGRLTVLGRVDDVVVTGGHKVEPRDVETALRALPQVLDASSSGCPTRSGASAWPLWWPWRGTHGESGRRSRPRQSRCGRRCGSGVTSPRTPCRSRSRSSGRSRCSRPASRTARRHGGYSPTVAEWDLHPS
ncbi:hypothetical protein BJF86_00490 [Serinicoccus sp. CNJ-927]|nr:AMP-binding protein [Serinicoccus sp. CNJ-927]OLT43322.1 hypothetical protein BJF86_00490 [Serinicoccus sp. CNJ-927]